MQTVNQSTFAQNLSVLMDRLSQDHVPLLITRDTAEPAVLVSWSDFRALEEAASLRPNPIQDKHPLDQGYPRQTLTIQDLKGCVSYKGPPVSLADMDAAIAMDTNPSSPLIKSHP